MNEFIEKSSRSIELPLGCKDLIDVNEIRSWPENVRPDRPKSVADQLAYLEGYLTHLLEGSVNGAVMMVSRHFDQGRIMLISDPDLNSHFLFPVWHGPAEEKSVRAVFEEADIQPFGGQAGRWKMPRRSQAYKLATEPVMTARFIGQLLRTGYLLGDLSVVRIWYYESSAA